MSSPSPGASGSSAPSRRISSNSAFVNNLSSLAGQAVSLSSNNRSLSPPHSMSSGTGINPQSSPAPNSSFLQNLSSRLRERYPASGGGGMSRVVLGDIFDAAGMPGIPSSSSSFNFRSGGTNFGIPMSSERGGGGGPPFINNNEEFPTLGTVTSSRDLVGGSAPGSNRPNYGHVFVKDSHDPRKPDFDLKPEEFPELSKTLTPSDGSAGSFSQGLGGLGSNLGSGFNSGPVGTFGIHSSAGPSFTSAGPGAITPSKNQQQLQQMQASKSGIQTDKHTGRVSNIPMGMVTDQFGMIGLLTFIRVAESNPDLVSLALGTDLTNLKLDLNSPDPLYSAFPGPWSSESLKPYEIDYQVPSEYLIHNQIKDKLALIRDKLNRYGEDILFFLFYMFPNDVLQIAASNELYSRDWRYHKDEKIWITRHPGYPPSEKTDRYERGTYFYFDPTNWKRMAKEFHLDYDRLESSPARVTFDRSSSVGSSSSGGSVVPSPGQPLVNLMS